MSDFKVRFRDPQSGRQVELEADRQKSSWYAGNVAESFDSATVTNDGQVDVMVDESMWGFRRSHHLGVSTENLTPEDAAALKRALENPNASGLQVFDLGRGRSLDSLRVLQTDAAGELTDVSVNLDATGARREVRLTPSGHIATPNGQEPTTPKEIGDGLFRAASLIDDVSGNLFDNIQATMPLKEKMLDNLVSSMETAAPGQVADGLDETQTLQMRSSAATTMLELMTSSTNNTPEFQTQVFEQYEAAVQKETNPLLKDSMVFNLHRLQDTLPAELQERVGGLMETVAPTKPPYDAWFADGDSTVKIAFAAGHESYQDGIDRLKGEGFEVASQSHGKTTLTKTVERNGVETTFEINMRNYSSDMYAEMNDPDVDIQMYSGHSNWGRNVRSSLKNAPEGTGKNKLILTDLCVGKGEIQMTRDKYPEAHLITTHNSSYFRPGQDSEGIHALLNVMDGIADRKGYSDMAEATRLDNPWKWTHERSGVDNNFIFPTDLETRRRVLDQDHDGQADVFDRMVNFNTFDVETDTAREFEAIVPSRDTEELVGTKIHFASQTINRMTIYSGVMKDTNSAGEVVPGGYFTPEEGEDRLFRFEKVEMNGEPTVRMTMNADFAHMSEEALRMAASYEYAMYKVDEGDISLNPEQAKMNAMIFASHSLYTDAGHRDSTVWKEFLTAYNLPDVSRSDVESAKSADDHYYSGSRASLTSLWGKLSPEVQEALQTEGVGYRSAGE
ncbi:MAG: hypothetical protein EP343_18735 [Deltaproteobacteria bacterium]|nr:MAG: hypothetical protein EP343_18735 [Deltaproteobacteria bacterium]